MVDSFKINKQKLKLIGSRIELFPVSCKYLNDFHEYSIIGEFYTFFEYSAFQSITKSEEYLNKLISRSHKPENQYMFIYEINYKKVIGTIGVLDVHDIRLSAEIGYGISPNFWGRGYFNETLGVLLDYLFNTINLNRVVAKTSVTNIPSNKGLQKLGFKIEGQLRDFYRIDEKFVDANIMSMLKTEYNSKNNK
jgi:[ribosomal protein S5]-alanine N-acetyltransferase